MRRLANGFGEHSQRVSIQLVDFGGGDEAEFEIGDGAGVIAEGGGEGVVAEIAAAARDDYEVAGDELLECFRI